MKLDKFNTTLLQHGHCYIEFKKPLSEEYDKGDIRDLIEYFGQKKHKAEILKIDRTSDPITITGILFKKKIYWARFMERINLDGRRWYEKIRDKPIMDIEDGLMILEELAIANRKAATQMQENSKLIKERKENEIRL